MCVYMYIYRGHRENPTTVVMCVPCTHSHSYLRVCVRVEEGGCVRVYMIDMGWLQLVGSLKLQVSFAKEPYKRDDILQLRPIILRSLLIVATPWVKY